MALSLEQIQEARQRYGIKAKPEGGRIDKAGELRNAWTIAEETAEEEPEREQSGIERVARKAYEINKDLATGFAKGGTSTFLGLGRLGQKIQEGVGTAIDTATRAPLIGDILPDTNLAETARGGIFDPESEQGKMAREITTPENTTEEIGKGIEQTAEFFLPAGAASKAEKAVNVASQAIRSPFLAGTARVLGTAAAQGVPAAGVRLAQTDGDVESAVETGLLAGAARGALQVIGEGAKAMKIPERLYSTIFKNTKQDMMAELKANGIENIRRNDPKLFEQLVKDGIVQSGEKGKAIVNETLAEQALSKGLQGSIDNMADEVVRGSLKSEQAVREIAKGYKGTIDLSEEQFPKVLKELAEEYENVGFGEVGAEATRLSDDLVKSGGKVNAETALNIRRFLDRMRIAASFDKPVNKLSTAQGNLKTLADAVRTRINAVPEMGAVMKDYSFYIDALENLAREAARTGNNQVLSLIDSLFLAGGAASGSVVPVAGAILNKLLLKGAEGATRLGQTLERGVAGPLMGGGIGATSAGLEAATDQ